MEQKIRFIYNGKQYQTGNLEKKLNSLGITIDDIELIKEKPKEYVTINTYTFKNKVNGHTLISIYPDMKNVSHLYNVEEWERC